MWLTPGERLHRADERQLLHCDEVGRHGQDPQPDPQFEHMFSRLSKK
jgi:hypothetical protein